MLLIFDAPLVVLKIARWFIFDFINPAVVVPRGLAATADAPL